MKSISDCFPIFMYHFELVDLTTSSRTVSTFLHVKKSFKTSQYVSGHIPTENFAKAICILSHVDEHTDYMWYQANYYIYFLLTINIECNITFSAQNCECNDLVIITFQNVVQSSAHPYVACTVNMDLWKLLDAQSANAVSCHN